MTTKERRCMKKLSSGADMDQFFKKVPKHDTYWVLLVCTSLLLLWNELCLQKHILNRVCLSERILWVTQHPKFTWFVQPCVAARPLKPSVHELKVQGPLRCARGLFHPQCPNIYCPASAGCGIPRKAVVSLLTLGLDRLHWAILWITSNRHKNDTNI